MKPKSVGKSSTKPSVKHTTKPSVKHTTKPSVKHTTKPSTKPTIKSTIKHKHTMKSKTISKAIKNTSNTSNKNNTNDLYHKKKHTYKIVKMLSNIKKFTLFYKKLSAEKKEIIDFYKGTGYININSFLYKNNTIDNLTIDEYLYNDKIKNYFSKNTREIFDFKNINVENIPKVVEFYINKNIINKINVLDSIFIDKNISKLDGTEILFRGTRGHSITTDKTKIGDEIIIKNFCSSSTENDISMNFTNLWGWKTKQKNENICCLYVLSGLKDVPYIYIPWNTKKQLIKQEITVVSGDEFEYLLPRNLKFKLIKITKGLNIDSSEHSPLNKITFEKFEKLLKGKSLNSMDNNDIKSIINKLYKKINVYHLEFIEQTPIKPIEPYVYKQNINLHFQSSKPSKSSSKMHSFTKLNSSNDI